MENTSNQNFSIMYHMYVGTHVLVPTNGFVGWEHSQSQLSVNSSQLPHPFFQQVH